MQTCSKPPPAVCPARRSPSVSTFKAVAMYPARALLRTLLLSALLATPFLTDRMPSARRDAWNRDRAAVR